MAIVVRHDADPGIYQYLAQMRSQQQGRNRLPAAEEQENINPYVLGAREGAGINARLRADRERLGQKQRAEYGQDYFRDTEAGFDWKLPISLQRPDGSNQTLYYSGGVDPLGNGALGALGTKEQFVRGDTSGINPYDPYDNKVLGAIARGPSGYMQLDEEVFMTPQERQDAQRQRQIQEQRQNYMFQQNEMEQRQARLQEDRQRQAENQNTYDKYVKMDEDYKKEKSKKQAAADEAAGIALAGSMMGDEAGLTPAQQANRQKMLSAMAAVQSQLAEGKINERQAKFAMDELNKRLEAVSKPLTPQRTYGEAREYVDAQGNTWTEQTDSTGRVTRTMTGRAARPQRTPRPNYTPGQVLDAEESFFSMNGRYPSEAELDAILARGVGAASRANAIGQQQVPPDGESTLLQQLMELKKLGMTREEAIEYLSGGI